MEETKEERIQRLVKEGIAKAKLNDKTSGKCFGGKKEPYRSDKPPTPPTLIGKPSKTWNTGENPPIDEPPVEILTKTPFPVLNVVIVVVLSVMVVILALPTSPLNIYDYLTGESSEARAEIFANANALTQNCKNAVVAYNKDKSNVNKIDAINVCQDNLDYFYANREVLDSGTIKNWASDTIAILEENKAKGTGTSGGTSGGTGTGTSGGTGTGTGKWSGTFMYTENVGNPILRVEGNFILNFKRNGDNIQGSYTMTNIKMTQLHSFDQVTFPKTGPDRNEDISGTISGIQIKFDNGCPSTDASLTICRRFSGIFSDNSLQLNLESCSLNQYCVDPALVGKILVTPNPGEPTPVYVSEPGIKGTITLTRQ